MAKKFKLEKWHIFLAIGVVALFLILPGLMKKEDYKGITDKGVTMKVYAADASGNPLYELTQTAPQTYSIVSRNGGQYQIADYIMIESSVQNIGTTNIRLKSAAGTNPCAAGNTNPSCPVPNNYGGTDVGTIGGTDNGHGDINGIYANLFAAEPNGYIELANGESNTGVMSEPISVTNLAAGNIEFTLSFGATYITERGVEENVAPGSILGSVVLKIEPETCSDGTAIGQCSQTLNGKACGVINNEPTLYNNATVCTCCYGTLGPSPCGWQPITGNEDQCTDLICAGGTVRPGECLPNSINVCLVDGSTEQRCVQCGFANCAENYYTDDAVGCDPSANDPSVCDYPDRSTSALVTLNW